MTTRKSKCCYRTRHNMVVLYLFVYLFIFFISNIYTDRFNSAYAGIMEACVTNQLTILMD